ncbi:hypothetical protein LX87_04993 [Larkinella arboricola]|uniref:Lipoprotein n=1 Tax=Larkinella arboricola TaxID=643671 RepID=A0A327WPL5_LARAB|nr:hypothetical protein LX87_04993 [Larkinella arboricola]
MNTNIKLFQSALGLAIGLWMIACGGSVMHKKTPAVKTSSKSRVASSLPAGKSLSVTPSGNLTALSAR